MAHDSEFSALLRRMARSHLGTASAAFDQAAEEIDRLRAALKPFAAVADEYADQEDDSHEVWIDAGPEKLIRASFALKLYRAARAALSQQPQN